MNAKLVGQQVKWTLQPSGPGTKFSAYSELEKKTKDSSIYDSETHQIMVETYLAAEIEIWEQIFP